jgi:hypothetical protein
VRAPRVGAGSALSLLARSVLALSGDGALWRSLAKVGAEEPLDDGAMSDSVARSAGNGGEGGEPPADEAADSEAATDDGGGGAWTGGEGGGLAAAGDSESTRGGEPFVAELWCKATAAMPHTTSRPASAAA